MGVGGSLEIVYPLQGPLPAGTYVIGVAGFQQTRDAQMHFALIYYPECENIAAPRFGMFCAGIHSGVEQTFFAPDEPQPTRRTLAAPPTHQRCLVTACNGGGTSLFTNPGDCAQTPVGALPAAGAGAFICACHGSEFTSDGLVLAGPATEPLPAVALRRDGDDILIDLGTPAGRSERVV